MVMETRTTGLTTLTECAVGATIGSCREVNEDAFGVFAEQSNVFSCAWCDRR